ncbi:MAG TPA: hypothetical protein PKW33_10820 [Anaerolineaceae bacterium]|nr:hypothetical protein [Anaerolineaceae bacterium]HPN52070.1 hypothetical protein [Anaerolineaceae bacterium]
MYKIEKASYGFHLIFSGMINAEEMQAWVRDAKKALSGPLPKQFGVFVDMRDLKPLDDATTQHMVEGQKEFKIKGMVRSVVILHNAVVTMQFKRLAKASGIYEWERYLDASTTPDFEKVGIAWLVQGIDPDK